MNVETMDTSRTVILLLNIGDCDSAAPEPKAAQDITRGERGKGTGGDAACCYTSVASREALRKP